MNIIIVVVFIVVDQSCRSRYLRDRLFRLHKWEANAAVSYTHRPLSSPRFTRCLKSIRVEGNDEHKDASGRSVKRGAKERIVLGAERDDR